MYIGKLRKQVALQQEQKTPDGAGGYALAWTTLATVWADIIPQSGKEVFASGPLEGHVTHKITMRWRADLAPTTAMRLMIGARAFNIRSVINKDEGNRWIVLLVEEGGAV
jgi:SPP1 family predicted phage head-tail adaptor